MFSSIMLFPEDLMPSNSENIRSNYAAPNLLEEIQAAFAAIGKPISSLTLDDLAAVDEFHVRGVKATEELIQLLKPTSGMHILDAGSGLGGPARRIATAVNCRVTGIDLSEDYCRAGNRLSEWVGLQEQVELRSGSVTNMSDFTDDSFDAAFTIHVAMNIENKPAFYSEIARVLKPGAAFLIYDIFSVGNQAIDFPVPWATDASSSFLATPSAVKQWLNEANFVIEHEIDNTAAGATFMSAVAERFSKQQPGAIPNLSLLTGRRSAEKFMNLAQNLKNRKVSLAMLLCRTPG